MKKTGITLLIIIAAFELKAQQLWLKPMDSARLKGQLIFPGLKPDGNSALLNKYFSLPKQQAPLLAMKGLKENKGEIFYSRMPVAKLKADDNGILIIKPKPGERYTMLIKKEKVVDPLAKTPLLMPSIQNPYSPASPIQKNQY